MMRILLPFLPLAALALGAPAQQSAIKFWYEEIEHNGINAGIENGKNWTVFRNVKDFGAKGDGTTDDSAAIQNAISMGDNTGPRDSRRFGATGQPAMVYFPAGTYLVNSTIYSAVSTVIMGDPTNLPTIKAASNFRGASLLFGHDQFHSGLIGFYHGVKNLVLDTTAVPSTQSIALLEWSVSQNNLLSNVEFNMPVGATKHIGVATNGISSALIMNNLKFVGGGIGVSLSVTQYHLKSLYFKDVQTGIKFVSVRQLTAQDLRFESCNIGIDASSAGSGMLNLIDSSATNTSVLVSAADSSSAQGSLVLENVVVDSSVSATVMTPTSILLTSSVRPNTAWIRGNTYHTNSTSTPTFSRGVLIPVSRPASLINPVTYRYPALTPPTYAEYPLSSIINVKSVASHPVHGDGVTDDTASLQFILDAAAKEGKVVYFPHGIYLLTDTLVIPPGSRLIGEVWTQLSASGPKFASAANPRPMLRVGEPGSRGVAQMSDFIFTVADILPGAILMEVNMSGDRAGDVGFWNCHFRVGGARGSKVRGEQCRRPETCLAARLNLHLQSGSGSYWENVWQWTADHDLDVPVEGITNATAGPTNGDVYPGVAGGILIEARRGTWMLGMGAEHNVLYQVNINKAKDVFIGLQQSEAAYWQGKNNTVLAPEPWMQSLWKNDPEFAWCEATDDECRMGIYQRISHSKNINIYSSGFWNFVSGPLRTYCAGDCQDNAAVYEENEKMYIYGLSTINSRNMVLEQMGKSNVSVVATREDNEVAFLDGFRHATVGGYFRQSA